MCLLRGEGGGIIRGAAQQVPFRVKWRGSLRSALNLMPEELGNRVMQRIAVPVTRKIMLNQESKSAMSIQPNPIAL
jgi:hypothetical protein